MYVAIANRTDEQDFPYPDTQFTATLPTTRLRRQEHLFREGDRVVHLYRVVTGAVRLSRLLEDGRRQIIAFGFPGDIIGFPSAGRHNADCEALTLVELQPYRLSSLVTDTGDAKILKPFLWAALGEIAAMQDHFMMLGRKSASEKVASFLVVLADRIGAPIGQYTQVDLAMSRTDIADFLGLTTETVSRTISQLCKSRIIALDAIHSVIVLRPDALRALADGGGN